ncbi:MAG: DMT family transporter [Christensenellales bacterium]|jgi:transporter family-2 protein
MYHFLAVFAGVLIAGMVVQNGRLADFYGLYPSTLLIHAVGLLFSLGFAAVKRESLRPKARLSPRYYIGGAIGAATTLFNNLAFGHISVSAILALTLLGQSITSFCIDAFGLFDMEKQSFDKRKLLGLFLISAGIVLMIVL